jgi:hypothetical protein
MTDGEWWQIGRVLSMLYELSDGDPVKAWTLTLMMCLTKDEGETKLEHLRPIQLLGVLLNFYYGAGVLSVLKSPEGMAKIDPMQKGFISRRYLDN